MHQLARARAFAAGCYRKSATCADRRRNPERLVECNVCGQRLPCMARRAGLPLTTHIWPQHNTHNNATTAARGVAPSSRACATTQSLRHHPELAPPPPPLAARGIPPHFQSLRIDMFLSESCEHPHAKMLGSEIVIGLASSIQDCIVGQPGLLDSSQKTASPAAADRLNSKDDAVASHQDITLSCQACRAGKAVAKASWSRARGAHHSANMP